MPSPPAPRSCSCPTSSIGPRPSPTARSPSPAGWPTPPRPTTGPRRCPRPPHLVRSPVLHDAALIAGKDLLLEWRSRLTVNQVMPFAFLVLVLFAFALDPDRRILLQATPGLFWLAVLFSALLAIQRAFVVETQDGVRDALRLSGLDPAGIFVGKAAVISVHLAAVELVLGVGVWVLYGARFHGPFLVVATCVAATI